MKPLTRDLDRQIARLQLAIDLAEIESGKATKRKRKTKTPMKNRMKSLLITIGLAFAVSVTHAAEVKAEPRASLYFDSLLTAQTTEFNSESYGYGLRVGYALTKSWALEASAVHDGLNVEGKGVSDVGLRLVAGAPLKKFNSVRPYVYVGSGYHLVRDGWHIDPGAGLEFALTKRLSVFAESGLSATLENRFDWTGGAGVRLRF